MIKRAIKALLPLRFWPNSWLVEEAAPRLSAFDEDLARRFDAAVDEVVSGADVEQSLRKHVPEAFEDSVP